MTCKSTIVVQEKSVKSPVIAKNRRSMAAFFGHAIRSKVGFF
jgi:hypothetical protein